MKKRCLSHSGFTFIEVVIVMGLVGLLVTIASTSLFQGRQRISVDTIAQQLMNDIREQQMKAILGSSASASVSMDYSVSIGLTNYTLFPGNTYISDDGLNTVIPLDASLTLSSTFPSNMVTFKALSGDVVGFQNGSASITIHDTQSGLTRDLELNRRGVFIKGL